MPQVIRNCAYCTAEFIGRDGPKAKKYCSDECRKLGKPPVYNKGRKTGQPSPRRITRYCKACYAEYIGHKSRMYCSDECRDSVERPAWNKELTGTKGKPRNGAEKICEVCNAPFYVPKVRMDSKYCSPECYFKGRWGDSHKETVVCVICGTQFEAYVMENRKVCSKECKRENLSRMTQGENCHFWRGGKMAPYVGEWRTQRRAARERDGYKCTLCGSTDRIQVHHIIPYRYSQSHDLSNLVTLCRSCHSREELKVNPAKVQALQRRWSKNHPEEASADNP